MLMRPLGIGTALVATAAAAMLWAGAGTAAGTAATAACHVTQKKSISGGTKTNITFVNKTRGAVQLYWLDYKGHLVYYNTVAPGARVVQRTFKTHPWLVLDGNDVCVGYVIAPKVTYTVLP